MTRKRQKSTSCSASVVLRLLEKCPIRTLKLHCFITDIPHCLRSLAKPQTLQSLDLTLTNKSNSPPLEDLLSDVAVDLGLGALSLSPSADAPSPKSPLSAYTSSVHRVRAGDVQRDRLPPVGADTGSVGVPAAPSFSADSLASVSVPSVRSLVIPTAAAPLTAFPALKDLSLDSSHLQVPCSYPRSPSGTSLLTISALLST
jgi:hypothetical protein